MSKVIVTGGGPAGMFAAIAAAENGHQVLLLEKNEKLGKKLFITGKGRCNLTNACDMETLLSGVISNPRFLYSAFSAYDNGRVIDFFEKEGLALKKERGGRIFPVSDHSSDVIAVLAKKLKDTHVSVRLNTEVEQVLAEPYALEESAKSEDSGKRGKEMQKTKVSGVALKDGETVYADSVIIATGGYSYRATGSTGDGYRFAESLGHTVTELTPSLVPFRTKEAYVKDMQGLSLKNVTVRIRFEKKLLFEEFGEMLFTHFGVSGPLILTASARISSKYKKNELEMEIDLKPALSEEQLDMRVLKDLGEAKNRLFKNSLGKLFPAKLLPVILKLSTIDPEKRANEITREERLSFVRLIKAFPLTLTGTSDFNEAIITRGGIKVKEVNPSTMESKLVKNLFFCGEVLDLDALTGGFNLQIAWSTGYLAGNSVS